MIDSHYQLIVKCCYPWNVWEKYDPTWGDHFISSRYCVSCRFCQNSFCHFYLSLCAPEEKFFVDVSEESPRIRVKFWNSLLLEIMAKLTKMWGKGRHRRWGCRCCFWCSRVGDLSVWVAWFHFLWICPKKDWRDRLCLSVLLTPLDLHNVNFQILKIPLTFYLDFLAGRS